MIRYISISLLWLLTACDHHQSRYAGKPRSPKKFQAITFLRYENFDTSLLNAAVSEAAAFYQCSVTVLPPQPLPSFAYYEPRQRYKADSLLKFQLGLLPHGAGSVVGFTNKDISTSLGDKADWGIFGLGYRRGNAAVISVFRLKSGSYDAFKERFIKVVLHELGHNMGLPHCNASEYCLMTDAKGTAATVDKEKKWLCSNCRHRLSN